MFYFHPFVVGTKLLIVRVGTKAYFLSECVDCFFDFENELSIKYQSYPKSRKSDAFGQEICFCHYPTK